MKSVNVILAACLAFMAGHASAEVSDMTLGYCAGELPAKGDISYGEADKWVSGAIYITPGMLSTYSGNELVGVNAGLASKLNIDELTVWLRHDLEGENLAEATITTSTDPKIVKGWNAVDFEQAWTIPASVEKGVYIGYSFHQKGSAFGVAAIDTPAPNAFFVKFGEGDWEDRSAEGTICIEGRMRGEKLPKVNLSLQSLEVEPTYVIDRGTLKVNGVVKNMATLTVTGFDVSSEVNGERRGTVHVDCELPYNTSGDFEVALPLGITEIGDGQGEVTVIIDGINEGADEDMSDNSMTRTFGIVQRDFTRRILVEEFTSEACINCPRVAGYMHDSLEKDEFKDNVLAICHHSGYYPDWLTSSFDNEYTVLYNGDTYAPGMAVDRMVVGDNSAVWCPSSSSDMESKWRSALGRPAFVSVNARVLIDEENPDRLVVKVDGAKSKEVLCDSPMLTVFLLEDEVKPRGQAGGGTDFMHQHVGRAVNSAWGEPVEFVGDDYSYECEFVVKSNWNRENLQVVATVGNYNESNPLDCEVENTFGVRYADFLTTGVNSVVAGCGEAEYYTLSGVKVSADSLVPGIYVRRQGGVSEKVVVKR